MASFASSATTCGARKHAWTNCYALSKVWFRAKCVDLRVCDIKNITSSCKSWLYQDMFAKPEEMLLHRPHHYGGLGLHSTKYKALAGFITSFIQTAANPSFRSNLLHNLLYRKYVLEEECVPGAPNQPPAYFTQDFFAIIRKVKSESSLNIITMTERDWTRLLTEDYITMELNESGTRDFRPCRAEAASPTTDWTLSWTLSRQKGVPPDMASFLWKMLLDLLSTQERLHKMGATPSPLCKQCKLVTGSLKHELLECHLNNNVGQLLLGCLQTYIPGLSADTMLRLEFNNLDKDMELPSIILTAATLGYLWKERLSSTKIRTYQVRSEIEQTINLLRTTRLANAASTLDTMVNQMFQ